MLSPVYETALLILVLNAVSRETYAQLAVSGLVMAGNTKENLIGLQGSSPTVQIRGLASISANSSPLI